MPAASPPQASFRRVFALRRCSRIEGLDPRWWSQAIHPRSLRTARRLSISAIETNCEHNFRSIQTPHTAPKSPSTQLALRAARTPLEAQPAEVSRVRGRRGKPTTAPPCRDRSRRKLHPNPIRSGTSCRKPASAGGWSSLRRRYPSFEEHPQGRRAGPRFRETPPVRAASRAPPRRRARSAAPEVPSIDRTTPERVRPRPAEPLSPAIQQEPRAGAFSFTARSTALARRKTTMTRGLR